NWGSPSMPRCSEMSKMRSVLILSLLCLPCLPVAVPAADMPLEFSSAADEERYHRLLEELRCLVCQNQTLADSAADLAQDLRNEVHARIRAGQGDGEIIDFMVQRYGDFVLYRPPLKTSTWLLWAGPFLLLLLAAIIVLRRAHAASADGVAPLDDSEQQKLRALLPGSEGGDRP
ncbi:MAG: cytochrome c-type biogenesis protein, partial [Burkholderiales bacterium]